MSTIVISLAFILLLKTVASYNESFIFNGFNNSYLIFDEGAQITSDGLLRLSGNRNLQVGHVFYSTPLRFKDSPSFSFSTTFVFAIVPEYSTLGGHGFAFVLSPTPITNSHPSQFLGIFNETNMGNPSNHIVAVELDTILSVEFADIDDNHVGIDVNGLRSIESHTAGYFTSRDGMFHNLSLRSGNPMQLWVEYDGTNAQFNVTLSPIGVPKPDIPLISRTLNLSELILDSMYVGFSSSSGRIMSSHYILGWSFKMNGKAEHLDLSKLPSVTYTNMPPKGKHHKFFKIVLPVTLSAVMVLLIVIAVVGIMVWRANKFVELLEDWELGCRPSRFSYKDLYMATKGFRESELLGKGGFGRVYKGVLPTDKREVAIKKVSHESRQGMKEFVAEIISMGRLRHRNIVQLLGYCRRRRGELLLVYEYMPNGSLDKFLFGGNNQSLNWSQRYHIAKGIASGLFYLHGEWEKLVVHRDVKSSNVLLDSEMNGRLSDFGLARIYDHGSDPNTTRVAGTLGYIAPELTRTGKGTTASDVFAFGIFLLEIVCGRKPTDPQLTTSADEGVSLVDWVLDYWRRGVVMETVDARLGCDYVAEEVELVLKLGLLCTHIVPLARPNMRQVMQFFEGNVELPHLSPDYMNIDPQELEQYHQGFDVPFMSLHSSKMEESVLSGGR
ncbi:L-type lectin-domain containing receptor kinase IV.1 [Acorus gramineus]|uniref:non-specific serine/threonine protein kinase n=1 Tax=Acorus gramineus TaxID=55184 RepID=A0AAV9AXS7_ACOGR|nr:L-type lectin-domain containing receptor kinase IV.1 [Acorus gramineus]